MNCLCQKSAFFSFAGASFFVIMLHASLYSVRQEPDGFDLEMETV